jgi:hypothetical protein
MAVTMKIMFSTNVFVNVSKQSASSVFRVEIHFVSVGVNGAWSSSG